MHERVYVRKCFSKAAVWVWVGCLGVSSVISASLQRSQASERCQLRRDVSFWVHLNAGNIIYSYCLCWALKVFIPTNGAELLDQL